MKRQKMKKIIINSIIFILICMQSLFVFEGCEKESSTNSSGTRIYYVNQEEKKLVSENYSSDGAESTQLMEEYLEKLANNGEDEGSGAAIPSGVSVNTFNIIDGIATVDFSEEYLALDTWREVLCRSAIVLTLTQIKGVDYVAFTVNDTPLRQKDGSLVGTMKASDFVADLGGGTNTHATADFVLYFANEDGSMLKEYKLMNAKYGEKSKEAFIVEQLIKGPKKKGYTATLPSNIKIVNVMTANNICYVDFDGSFLTEQSSVSNTLAIYSIVNSLSELNEIHKVQISVNGDAMLKYHDEISLAEPFIRNLDLIETDEMTMESE